MAWIKTNIDDVWIFEPTIWKDKRGYFVETYNKANAPDSVRSINFVQDNESSSTKGVLRGLHYQLPPNAQSKLVRVIQGEVLDVIVDIRPKSPSFGRTFSVILNDISKKQLFVPKGFAHGYIVLSDAAIFAYKCDAYYSPSHEAGIIYDDNVLKIDWILDPGKWIVSEKDLLLPTFNEHVPFANK